MNCLGLFMFLHFCILFAPSSFSALFSPFLGFFAWVAFSRVSLPFLPWHRLLKPFSFLLSSVIYPHHGALETEVQFSPQDQLQGLL